MIMAKKKIVTNVGSESVSNGASDPGARAPAKGAILKPPTDWKPAKVGRGNGARPKGGQAANAATAGQELTTSTTYVEDFGSKAPSQTQLAHLMAGAGAWRGQWVASKRYTAYSAEQNATWWEATLDAADLLQPAFDYAVARDPSVADRYPGLTQFMQALSGIAKRAARTRKANVESKKGAATAPQVAKPATESTTTSATQAETVATQAAAATALPN
jgi:hypothetical protein